MKYWLMLACAGWLTIAGCSADSDTGSDGGPTRSCATDIAVREVQPFGNPVATRTEGITFGAASTPDGVAIDSEGNVYVALNINDEIAQVKPDGTVTIIAEGVDKPASLAFGQGEYDPCSLYATNLFGAQVWRVGIGVLGTEN